MKKHVRLSKKHKLEGSAQQLGSMVSTPKKKNNRMGDMFESRCRYLLFASSTFQSWYWVLGICQLCVAVFPFCACLSFVHCPHHHIYKAGFANNTTINDICLGPSSTMLFDYLCKLNWVIPSLHTRKKSHRATNSSKQLWSVYSGNLDCIQPTLQDCFQTIPIIHYTWNSYRISSSRFDHCIYLSSLCFR